MAMDIDSIQHGVSNAPPRLLIYGPPGVGKTTMLSQAPNPICIQTEDGEGLIDMPRFPLCKSYDDVMDALYTLATEKHNFSTMGMDSLDWFEPMVWEKVILDHGGNIDTKKGMKIVDRIEAFDYQKGYKLAMDYWREYTQAVNYLRGERGMMIIQIAHAVIQTIDNPETGSYDRYNIKLHTNKKGEGASAYLMQHSDCVLFVNYKVAIREEKGAFNQVKVRAVGSGQRMMFTQERPTFIAKNRYNLPAQINFDEQANYWGVLANNIPYLRNYVAPTTEPEPVEDVSQQQLPQPQTQGA
jgi:hypothetical protein